MEIHKHFMLYKPFGYISQFKIDPNKKSKKRLGELYAFPEGTMSIGRLDADSEGLLLLTTDGKVSFEVTATGRYEKEYYVQVDGLITPKAIEELVSGVEISVQGKTYLTKDCKASIIEAPELPQRSKSIRDERHGPTSWISISLREGKFRQVRKMTAKVGFPTLRLVRYRIGKHTIDGMDNGEVKELASIDFA